MERQITKDRMGKFSEIQRIMMNQRRKNREADNKGRNTKAESERHTREDMEPHKERWEAKDREADYISRDIDK